MEVYLNFFSMQIGILKVSALGPVSEELMERVSSDQLQRKKRSGSSYNGQIGNVKELRCWRF